MLLAFHDIMNDVPMELHADDENMAPSQVTSALHPQHARSSQDTVSTSGNSASTVLNDITSSTLNQRLAPTRRASTIVPSSVGLSDVPLPLPSNSTPPTNHSDNYDFVEPQACDLVVYELNTETNILRKSFDDSFALR